MRHEADKTRASKVISPESLKRDYVPIPDAPTGPSIVADPDGELWMVVTEDEEACCWLRRKSRRDRVRQGQRAVCGTQCTRTQMTCGNRLRG